MRFLATSLLVVLLVVAAALAEEPDWHAPAPEAEVDRANEFLLERFGEQVFLESIRVASSGLINSGGELTGYFVCYYFSPVQVIGVHATICAERNVGEEFRSMCPGEIPDCSANPVLCDVEIGVAEALEIAFNNGF